MNLIDKDDFILKCQKGSPIFIDDVCALYPAHIGEIVDEGYTTFKQYLGLLTSTKPQSKEMDTETEKIFSQLSDFEYILLTASADSEINELFKRAFLFFTHEDIIFSLNPAQIIVGPVEEQRIINEDNFYTFQHYLRQMYFIDVEEEEIIINADDSDAVKKLKLQMRANREKVRKAKAKQAAREQSDLKFSDLIGSITVNSCGLSMENIWNITYYAFHDQLKRMGWRDQFDINNRAALAGAKLNKTQLKHWIRSIVNSEK